MGMNSVDKEWTDSVGWVAPGGKHTQGEKPLPDNIVVAVLALGCSGWFLVLLSVLYNIRTVPRIETVYPPLPDSWPRLAVIVPACDEGDTLEATMRLRLKETYPNIQFVVVDDRSTDDTGIIADRIAADDPRFLVIHNKSLPEGWLGKVHALQQGVEASDSEWILFTDADVHVEPGVLEKAIAWCEHRKLDQLAMLPRLEVDRFGVKIFNAFFARFAMSGPAALRMIESPKTRMAAGVGAFNLFRRSALARTPGMERLRLEVIDDGALAIMLKAYGARCSILNGSSAVSLCWYPSVGAMEKGFEKNGFAIVLYSIPAMLAACAFLICSEWLPVFAMLQAGHPRLQLMGVLAYLCAVGATAAAGRAIRSAAAPALFYPVASLLMSYFLFRSGVLAVWRKGVVWRGTLYPLKTLRGFHRILLKPDKINKPQEGNNP